MSSKLDLNAVVEELLAKFIVSQSSGGVFLWEHLFFQMEAAYWSYCDMYAKEYSLPKLDFETVSQMLFNASPDLAPFAGSIDEFLSKFSKFKSKMPTFGAVLLSPNLDCVALVSNRRVRNWSFPKGKANSGEDEFDCAVREVLEETGVDVRGYIDPTSVISLSLPGRSVRLFIGIIPKDVKFASKCKEEVTDVAWIKLATIDTIFRANLVDKALPHITKWISAQKGSDSRSTSAPARSRADVNNIATFGGAKSQRWNADEMFRANEEKFGVKSNYDIGLYTTPLPKAAKR